MNRHLSLDGASVNSELCSDHHCNGWARAIAEKDALLAEIAIALRTSGCPCYDNAVMVATCIAGGICSCPNAELLAKYEAQK